MRQATRDKMILATAVLGLLLFNEVDPLPDQAPEVETVRSVPNFSKLEGTEKKQAFFSWLKPIVQLENSLIAKQRQRLQALSGHKLKASDAKWLKDLATEYDYRPAAKQKSDETIEQLLKRVNTVPLELALTQAAIESAWGTSRFAQQANNLFGQWCNVKGCGLVPLKRRSGATHEVKRFITVNDSVKAYLNNLNTHRAYKSLRNKRAALVNINQEVTAEDLAATLNFYSERGGAYVQDLTRFIRKNKHLM